MRTAHFSLVLSATACVCTLAAAAATAGARGAQSPDKLLPALLYVFDYDYYDHLYTQTLNGGEWSEIEARVKDNGGTPRTVVHLTGRDAAKSVAYASPEIALELGARPTAIQYVHPKAVVPNATAGFAFSGDAGKPVRWRFAFAYPPSAQGSGMTLLPKDTGLKLIYRNLGTLSSANSAVEIAGAVDEVQLWKEISQPPFFMAYRATYTSGAHFAQLRQTPRTVQVPAAAAQPWTAGVKRDIVTAPGAGRSLSVTSGGGGLLLTSASDANGQSREIAFTPAEGGYGVRHIRVSDGARSSTITFTPALQIGTNAAAPAEFQITADKNRKLANGSAKITYDSTGAHLTWTVKDPVWAKGRTVVQKLAASGDTWIISQ